MLVGSHYRIGGFVYRFIISKYIPFSPIDKILFQVGNMLPDLSSELSKLEHTVEGSAKPCRFHIKRAQDPQLTSGERMISLGILCHYLTDSFCSYHAKEPYKNRSIPRHLFYELKLHLVLLTLLPYSRKLYGQLLAEEANHIEAQNAEEFFLTDNTNSIHLQKLLFSLQREYGSQKSTLRTDLRFALKATLFSSAIIMEEFTVKAPAKLVFDVSTPGDGSLHRSR